MKAQVSLDLILTLLIVFGVVGGLLLFANSVAGMQRDAVIKQQLDSIGTQLASAVTASAALNDADTSAVSFQIPMIHVVGDKNPRECNILIDTATDTITLSFDSVVVEKGFVEPAGMQIQDTSPKCGTTLDIAKS